MGQSKIQKNLATQVEIIFGPNHKSTLKDFSDQVQLSFT